MDVTRNIRLLLVIIATLAAVIVGIIAGQLAKVDGGRLPHCIRAGAAAFSTTLALLLLVLSSSGAL